MNGIDQLLDAYESSGGGKPAAPAATGIDALLDAYERPRARPAERDAPEAPPRRRGRLIIERAPFQFEPGARSDDGELVPDALAKVGDFADSTIRKTAAAVESAGVPGRIAVNTAREIEPVAKGLVYGPLQAADALVFQQGRNLIADEMLVRGQREQAAAIGIPAERAVTTPLPMLPEDAARQRGQREQAAAIGVPAERVRVPYAGGPEREGMFQRPFQELAKDMATGMQRRYLDQPQSAAERGQAGQREQAAAIGIPADRVTPSADPNVSRGPADILRDMNPPAPGEAVGIERQIQEPLSTFLDAFGVVGSMMRPTPRGPSAGTFDAARAARAEDVRAGRIERGRTAGEARRAAAGASTRPVVTIERAPTPEAAAAARAADRATKARADAVTAGMRFNAQRIAAEADRAEAVSPEVVGARAIERGAARSARREAARSAEAARVAATERARNRTWTANEVRDELGVDFGTAQRIARQRNAKVSQARAMAQIEPGQEAVVRVGEQTFRVTRTASEDPIVRREINDAVRAATKPEATPAPRGEPRPVGVQPVARAPGAKMHADVVTGKDYPARFTGRADDSPVMLERSARAERRKRLAAVRRDQRGMTTIPGEVVSAADATYNRTLDIIGEAAKRGGYAVGRTRDAYTRAAASPVAMQTRRLLEAAGDAAWQGAQMATESALASLEDRFPSAGAAARAAVKVYRDTVHGSRAYTPQVYRDALTRKLVNETEPRQERIDALARKLETVPPDALRALFFEKTFDGVPQLSPELSSLVNDARPALRALNDLLSELGAREEHHGRITKHTREYMGPNYYPHRLVQNGVSAVQAALTERGVLKTLKARGAAKIKGRTRTDVEFWNAEGTRKDLVWHVLDEVMRRHEQLDRLDVLAEMAAEERFGVPKQPLINEKDLRTRQSAWLDNAALGGARTVSDALHLLDIEIDGIINKRMEINASLGADPATRARLAPEVIALDKKWTRLASQWEDLAHLKNEGIGSLDAAREHVAKEIASLDTKLEELPNEVAKLSARTGIEYIPIREAFRRLGRDPGAGNDANLGLMRDGWVDASLVDTDALDILLPRAQTSLHRNALALANMWRFFHTVANRPSWVNNGLGASMLAALGRFPMRAQPAFVGQALGDILAGAARVNEARLNGLNLNPKLTRSDVRARLSRMREGEVTPTALEDLSKRLRDARWTRGYRVIDDAVRLGMYDYNIRVRKMEPRAAAEHANHWVLDPADKPVTLRKLEAMGGTFVLPPFMSIWLQSVPRLVEGAATNPVTFAALGTLGWTSRELARIAGAQSDDDVERRARVRSTKERMETLAVPMRDDAGNPIEHNMSNWNPVAGFLNPGIRAGGGIPAVVADAITNAPNPETGRPSPYPLRRLVAGAVSPEAGRLLDVYDAMNPERGRLDENKEEMTLPRALTKAAVPANYRTASTDMLERGAKLRAEARVNELRSQFRRLSPRAQESPANNAELERKINEVWREAGFLSGNPDEAGPPLVPVDYSKGLVIRGRRQ